LTSTLHSTDQQDTNYTNPVHTHTVKSKTTHNTFTFASTNNETTLLYCEVC